METQSTAPLPTQALTRGYRHDAGTHSYTCLACGDRFEEGEIYAFEGRFFAAGRAIRQHMQARHPDYLASLIDRDSKYNNLTANQRQLMQLFAAGHSDAEVAKKLGVSLSTVRHQKFVFREKAKQAGFYLAVFEGVFGGQDDTDTLIPIPESARGVDERFIITQKERDQVLRTAFESLTPLRLKAFPRKEKKKIVVLGEVAGQFEKGKEYTEKEVNTLIEAVFDDFVTLRRYLVDYGFLARTSDGGRYWVP